MSTPESRTQELLELVDGTGIPVAHLLCDRHDPEAVAFTVVEQDLSRRELTYGHLTERSQRAAAALAELGVRAGDRVATLMGKGEDLVVTLLGIWRLGATHIPLFTAFAPSAIAQRLRDVEHEGDEATHAIIRKVNTSFVTPFEHEDILELAASLDDCIDYIDAVGQTVVLYRMDGLMPEVTTQMEVITRMAELTAAAMPRLATMKELREYWVEINRLENEGDSIYRGMLRDLFGGAVTDPIEVIKHKDIIERLEEATDAFESVAHRIEGIAIKES